MIRKKTKAAVPTKKKSAVTVIKNKKNKKESFPVVAIGASAGGLEAVSQLLKNLPPNTGMAYIYVQHLSPDHKSFLTSLLAKKTTMQVQEIEEMEHMAPNNIYIIPNNKGIKVINGHIKLTPRLRKGAPVSIDVLFSSLAETHKENVIGIILSGNGSDGTIGMKSIKEKGGITIAQDTSAKYKSMPESSIKAGVVDYILSPEKIAKRLICLQKKGGILLEPDVPDVSIFKKNHLSMPAILELINLKKGVDFTSYKSATIQRRIIHRMLLTKTSTLKGYETLVKQSPTEITDLYNDLLINVTEFFRDKEAFRFLKNNSLPKLFQNNKEEKKIRIWIPACSTGEEAYSIAMICDEIQEKMKMPFTVLIFATDLSESAIKAARAGKYTEAAIKSVDPKRLKKYFIKKGEFYHIIKKLRDLCVFATHNILSDAPFSHIDFISFRNLLIYFDLAAQKKALSVLNFALVNGGYLLLGKSESLGAAAPLFTTINTRYKIFCRKSNSGIRTIPALSPKYNSTPARSKNIPASSKKISEDVSRELDNLIDATLLSSYMPACAIINKEIEIIKFRGDTSVFLSHQQGNASLNILKMTRPEFIFELRNAISEVMLENKSVLKSDIPLLPDKKFPGLRTVSFEVRPLDTGDEPLYLIVFDLQKAGNMTDGGRKGKQAPLLNDTTKKQIAELKRSGLEMLKVIESQERAYEELQVANEEIITASEEYQSLNEELETSREEIEATNEELTTTNQELQMRNEQLAESYIYSEAITETMHEPMLVLDKALRVKSANKSFYKKFLVTKSETEGRLLYELGNHQWDIGKLRGLLENIVKKNSFFYEYEFTGHFPGIGKKTMLLNARQLMQKTKNEHLIVLTFTDITDQIKASNDENAALADTIRTRTSALEQSFNDLKEKNSKLEKANNELETFSYISSHDLQEPLRKIRTFASYLLEEEYNQLSESGKHYMQRMQESALRMQHLIDDLLRYSQIKQGNFEFESADLRKLMEEVVNGLQETLDEKKGNVKITGNCTVKVIPYQFRQLIQNLLSNSIKFAHPQRFPRIIIKLKITPSSVMNLGLDMAPVDYCHISYADNGIGFDPSYKEKIFEVFQSLHKHHQYKGTGIGLAICKRIIENHNGIIMATGSPNKGAQFDIYIPCS